MPFGIEKKLSSSEETNAKYYPKLLSYVSLRKALKNNEATSELALIKEFECNCEQHKGLYKQAVVTENQDTLMIGNCNYTAKATGQVTINLEGSFLLNGYEFFSKHPDWKVRVAVTVGLSKSIEGKAVAILSDMLNDHHWGVKLAVIQALEVMKLKPAKIVLEQLANAKNTGKIGRLAYHAIKRINFGVDTNRLDKPTLRKIHHSTLSKKIYHPLSQTNKLLVSKKIFHGALNKDSLQKYFRHYDRLRSAHKPQFNSVEFHQRKTLVKVNRPTKEKTQHDKVNFTNNLFFKNALPISRLDKISNPKCGEIYWAVVDKIDPKVTRPVLITDVINQEAGNFLAAPLTSDISFPLYEGTIIEVEGKKSRVQITFERTIHRSLLLNKYGSISDSNLEVIRKARKSIKQKAAVSSQPFYFHKPKHNKSSVEVDDKKYTIEEVPVASEAESKISMVSETPSITIDTKNGRNREVSLSQFFKLTPDRKKCYWCIEIKNKKLSIPIDNPLNLLMYLSNVRDKHPKININLFQSLEEAEKRLKDKFGEKTISGHGICKGFILEINISQRSCIKLFYFGKYKEIQSKIDGVRKYSRDPKNGMKLDNRESMNEDTNYKKVKNSLSME